MLFALSPGRKTAIHFGRFSVDEMVKLLNDNWVCFCSSRSQIHWKKTSQRRLQCDGERRSEFGLSLAVCETTNDLYVESLDGLAEPGKCSSHAWPIDGVIIQRKSSRLESTQIDHTKNVYFIYQVLKIKKLFFDFVKSNGKAVSIYR